MKLGINLENQRFYALLAGNIVVLALIGIFVLRPLFGTLSKHTTEITKTRGEIAALQKKTDELRKLKETYPTFEQTYAPVIQNVPRTKDIAGYQAELEDLAILTRSGLLTVDTSGQDPNSQGQGQAKQVTVGGFPGFPVKVDITGSYANILDFVNRLETMDRFTRVTGMKLERSDTSGAIKATLDLQSFYFGK